MLVTSYFLYSMALLLAAEWAIRKFYRFVYDAVPPDQKIGCPQHLPLRGWRYRLECPNPLLANAGAFSILTYKLAATLLVGIPAMVFAILLVAGSI